MDDAPSHRLRQARERAGYKTAKEFAEKHEVPQPTYAMHESGKRGLRPDTAHRYADILGVSEAWLLTGSGPMQLQEDAAPFVPFFRVNVPVVGYVGAGAEVYPFDDFPLGEGLEKVPAPEGIGGESIVAVRIRGSSMHPMKEGWLLFFRRDQDGVPDDCVNNLCVVKVGNDGPTCVKEVRRTQDPCRFTLWSWNADPIEAVELDWAAKVLDIRPR